mgnify:CR=1 FL=1|jgi:hypothetical protein|tara:strand:+ start:10396 stop:10572 length:177 start_codon:yes stop_codon:yes gene_type:complete
MDNRKDKCVVCKKETPYMVSTPIDGRINYVEGAGQLCTPCWSSTYLKKRKDEKRDYAT